MENINFFWAGSEIGEKQNLSLTSFIDNGHNCILWLYKDMAVPEGVIKENADDIVSRNILDLWLSKPLQRHTYCTFSNYFRYVLIEKVGGWWVDLDVICLRNFSDIEDDYMFASPNYPLPELLSNFKDQLPLGQSWTGCFKSPRGAGYLKQMIAEIRKDVEKGCYPEFARWGTVLFTKAILNNGLMKYMKDKNFACHASLCRDIYKYNLTIPEDAYSIHLCNYLIPDSFYSEGSLYSKLLKRHLKKRYTCKMFI